MGPSPPKGRILKRPRERPEDLRKNKRNRESLIKSIMNKRKTVSIENMILKPTWMTSNTKDGALSNLEAASVDPSTVSPSGKSK